MTDSSDRLDRIEKIVESNARAIEAWSEGLESTKKIVESNARAIEAWDSRIAEGDQRIQTQLESSIADTVQMIADLGQRQQETDQRFEVFLAESRADRRRAEQQHQDWLADSASAQARFEQAMEANAAEHKAMMAAIARLGRD